MEATPIGVLSRLLFRPAKTPHIVLLDCGMTASLSERNKENLFRFFTVRFKLNCSLEQRWNIINLAFRR